MKYLDFLQDHIGKGLHDVTPPVTRWLNGVILHVERGKTTVRFTVRKEMTNPANVLHGGMHTTIMDDVIGMTVAAMALDNLYLSSNLAVDLLGPAQLGEEIDCQARIIRTGKTILHAEAEIRNKSGDLLSKMSSNLVNTGRPFKLKI